MKDEMPARIMNARSGIMKNTGAAGWWKRAVFYEAYVDKFAGTFKGMAEKLGYLNALGIDCIHVLPHYPSPMRDGGYDVTDYMNVRKELGTLADFREFVKNAHAAGIRVMIDMVLNHTSTEHPWFIEAQSSALSPKRNFFLWSKTAAEYAGAPNPFSDLKPSNWIYNPRSGDYHFSTFHEKQADLNWSNPRVFAEMMRVFDFWIRFGVDAFRLDAVPHLVKKEGTSCEGLPEVHAILKDIRAYLDRRHHPGSLPLLAEANASVETAKEYFGNGDECDLVYNFRLAEALLFAIARNDSLLLQKTTGSLSGIPERCAWANFLGHHDEISMKFLDDDARAELFAYFDPEENHRFKKGLSMRPATLTGLGLAGAGFGRANAGGRQEKIIEMFEMLLGAPGSPIIYYGDEIGMTNNPLPREEKDTRKSIRGKFDWQEADAQVSDPKSLFSRVSDMIRDWKRNYASRGPVPAEVTASTTPASPRPRLATVFARDVGQFSAKPRSDDETVLDVP